MNSNLVKNIRLGVVSMLTVCLLGACGGSSSGSGSTVAGVSGISNFCDNHSNMGKLIANKDDFAKQEGDFPQNDGEYPEEGTYERVAHDFKFGTLALTKEASLNDTCLKALTDTFIAKDGFSVHMLNLSGDKVSSAGLDYVLAKVVPYVQGKDTGDQDGYFSIIIKSGKQIDQGVVDTLKEKYDLNDDANVFISIDSQSEMLSDPEEGNDYLSETYYDEDQQSNDEAPYDQGSYE